MRLLAPESRGANLPLAPLDTTPLTDHQLECISPADLAEGQEGKHFYRTALQITAALPWRRRFKDLDSALESADKQLRIIGDMGLAVCQHEWELYPICRTDDEALRSFYNVQHRGTKAAPFITHNIPKGHILVAKVEYIPAGALGLDGALTSGRLLRDYRARARGIRLLDLDSSQCVLDTRTDEPVLVDIEPRQQVLRFNSKYR